MGAGFSHLPSHHRRHRGRFHPTYRSWQELPRDEHGNFQFVYGPSNQELEDEFTHVYSSYQYKTPPVAQSFIDRLPTLKLDHDASQLMTMVMPSSKSSSFSSCASSSTNTTETSTTSSSTSSSSGNYTATTSTSCCSTADDNECLICFASYTRGATLVSLPCGHSYHKACIEEWFYRQCTCPYCRYEFPTDDAAYERGRRERMALRSLPPDKERQRCWNAQSQQQSPQPHPQPQSRPFFLVDRLKQRQDELRDLQHRRTVLDQLSFSCSSSVSASCHENNETRTPSHPASLAIAVA
jgi:hypothetical protein